MTNRIKNITRSGIIAIIMTFASILPFQQAVAAEAQTIIANDLPSGYEDGHDHVVFTYYKKSWGWWSEISQEGPIGPGKRVTLYGEKDQQFKIVIRFINPHKHTTLKKRGPLTYTFNNPNFVSIREHEVYIQNH